MKHALPFVCATLALAGSCTFAQPLAPASSGTDPLDPMDPRNPPAVPALPTVDPAQERAPHAALAPLPGSEVLDEGDPRVDAVKATLPEALTPRALPVLEARRIERLKGLQSSQSAGLLRAAYPLTDVTYHLGWGLTPEAFARMLDAAPGRYSQVLQQCGLHDGAPLRLLEVQARQAREGALAARDRRSDVPDVVGPMSPSGRYAVALRLTRVGTESPVLALLQKPSSARIELTPQTGSTLLAPPAPVPLLDLGCPDGSLPNATLEAILDELFPQGGSGTGRLLLAQASLGELSSPGVMRVPGAAQAPVHAHVLAHEGSVLLTAYVRGAGVGAPEAFERVLQVMHERKALPVSLQRTLLDGRGSAAARFVFDGYELVLGMRLDASGERLTLALRKP